MGCCAGKAGVPKAKAEAMRILCDLAAVTPTTPETRTSAVLEALAALLNQCSAGDEKVLAAGRGCTPAPPGTAFGHLDLLSFLQGISYEGVAQYASDAALWAHQLGATSAVLQDMLGPARALAPTTAPPPPPPETERVFDDLVYTDGVAGDVYGDAEDVYGDAEDQLAADGGAMNPYMEVGGDHWQSASSSRCDSDESRYSNPYVEAEATGRPSPQLSAVSAYSSRTGRASRMSIV